MDSLARAHRGRDRLRDFLARHAGVEKDRAPRLDRRSLVCSRPIDSTFLDGFHGIHGSVDPGCLCLCVAGPGLAVRVARLVRSG